MLLSPRKNDLTSLFKKVRVFKDTLGVVFPVSCHRTENPKSLKLVKKGFQAIQRN